MSLPGVRHGCLLFFGCQKKGVAIHAYSNSTSGKEQRSPPPPQSSKLDAMNESPSSKGGDDRDGAAQVSGTESSSAAAGNGEGEELSALYCTTRLPEPASDKTKSNPSVWEEEGRAAGGDKRFPFRFSPRNCLKSSPTPPELPPTSQLPSPLPPRGPEQQPAGKTRQSDSLVGSSSLGIVRPGKARKSINKENHWYQTKEVAEQDANNEQQLEEGRLEQRHRKELQPRPGSSTTNRRKSSGELPPSSMPKSGRNSVSSAVVPRWSLGSSSRNSALIKSQDSTPTANSTSLPPRVKRRSGSGSIAVEGSKSKAKAKARRTVIKSADMAEEMQQDALACTVKAMDEFDVDKDIAAFIKQEFDKKHGAKWHCVVGKNFGSFVTHETRGFVYLYRGQVAVLLFKAG